MRDPLRERLRRPNQRRQALLEVGGRDLVEAVINLAGVDEVLALAPADVEPVPFTAIEREARGLDHDEVHTTVFKRSLCQTIPRHLLDLVPVLTQIAGSLLLGRKFGLDAARLAAISVCDLEEDRLTTLNRSCDLSRRTFGHGCSFMKLPQYMWGSVTMRQTCGVTMSATQHGLELARSESDK
jgi:hypothetical protein